jgi:nucleotide-binding universal stress UspA family protein
VSKSKTLSSIRRILLALDASPESLEALGAAAELASKMEAELHGLFIEDSKLLELAGAPFAHEILYATAQEAPLERASLERRLKAHAEQVRAALARAAREAKVEWTFRSVRGHLPEELLAMAEEMDLLTLGRRGWSLSATSRASGASLAALTRARPALLLSERGTLFTRPVLACYDGTEPARRGLELARWLASVGARCLVVLLFTQHAALAEAWKDELRGLPSARGLELRFRLMTPGDESQLLRAIQSEHAGALVMADEGAPWSPDQIEKLLRQVDASLIFLGGTAGPEME